jgi:gamma-glutamyltranspeptidase / glutathione hydrolase
MAGTQVALLAAAIAICVGTKGSLAQSPNAFGIPSADKPAPTSEITAAPGSRAQGWLAQGRSEVIARHGIVATSDPLAAEAGLEILR